jgi:hypothetical protein
MAQDELKRKGKQKEILVHAELVEAFLRFSVTTI